MTAYFSASELLAPPVERAAFSDRQAYVCAELSKLAYFRFEGGHSLDQAIEVAKAVFDDDPRLPALEEQLKLILSNAGTDAEGRAALGDILKAAEFELVDTFSTEGTQAFLCTRQIKRESGSEKKVAYLAFRGTEPTDFADIRTDVRAALRKVDLGGGDEVEMHSGYLDAFELVREDIVAALKKMACDQLILTGHSLGGALAMVATRLLSSDSTGACYTFGAPPIGTIEIQNTLKTPVYEIVNEVDIVPRLPNPWMSTGIVMLLRLVRLLAKSVTLLNALLAKGTWDERLESFIESMTRYRHPGYVSYLVGTGTAARLRVSVDYFDRMKWWSQTIWKRGFGGFGKMVGDHSIDLYIAKLRTHARNRR